MAQTTRADDVKAALVAMFEPHRGHKWVRVAPCVYCEPCGVRLYQGALPASQATFFAELEAMTLEGAPDDDER